MAQYECKGAATAAERKQFFGKTEKRACQEKLTDYFVENYS
jgi:hypothetical protein